MAVVVIDVPPDVGQLVQQAEPEVVEPVVAQRQCDDRSSVAEPERGPVQIGPRKVLDNHERDAVDAKKLPRLLRSLLRPAQLRDLLQEAPGHRADRIVAVREVAVRGRQHLPAPGLQRIGIHLGVRSQRGGLAVERRGGNGRAAGLFDERPDQFLGPRRQVREVRDPPALRHCLERKPAPVQLRQRPVAGVGWPAEQHVGRDSEVLVERTRHRHRDCTLAGEDLGDLCAAADERDQVAWAQAGLLHAKLNGGHRIRVFHRLVPALVQIDEVDQHVELAAFRTAGLGVHELVYPRQRRFVIRFRPNRLDVDHLHTLLTSTASYSAWVPTKRT